MKKTKTIGKFFTETGQASIVSNWITARQKEGLLQKEIKNILEINSIKTVSDLKHMRYPGSQTTAKAYAKIIDIQTSKDVKTDWPKGIKAPTGEVENDIRKPKLQMQEISNFIQEQTIQINSTRNVIKSHSELITDTRMKINNLQNTSKEFGERLNDLNDYDKHLHGRINQINSQIGEIKGNMITYYDQLNGLLNTVKNYRTAFQTDLNYADEFMKELADRITALQEKGIQPKTGLIRKFWRWLW
jgi:predicted  nucleic acid-binding Zn-ribbon protein